MKKEIVPTEAQEQKMLFEWVFYQSYKYPELKLCHHIPNGGSRNKIEAAKLKAQGVKPGVPDICLPVPNGEYHGLYIELKRRDGGHVSENQKAWLSALKACGYKAEICKGADEAVSMIEDYLNIRKRGQQNA